MLLWNICLASSPIMCYIAARVSVSDLSETQFSSFWFNVMRTYEKFIFTPLSPVHSMSGDKWCYKKE